jgi:hypothetical protein
MRCEVGGIVSDAEQDSRPPAMEPGHPPRIQTFKPRYSALLNRISVRIDDRQFHQAEIKRVSGRPDDGRNSRWRHLVSGSAVEKPLLFAPHSHDCESSVATSETSKCTSKAAAQENDRKFAARTRFFRQRSASYLIPNSLGRLVVVWLRKMPKCKSGAS